MKAGNTQSTPALCANSYDLRSVLSSSSEPGANVYALFNPAPYHSISFHKVFKNQTKTIKIRSVT